MLYRAFWPSKMTKAANYWTFCCINCMIKIGISKLRLSWWYAWVCDFSTSTGISCQTLTWCSLKCERLVFQFSLGCQSACWFYLSFIFVQSFFLVSYMHQTQASAWDTIMAMHEIQPFTPCIFLLISHLNYVKKWQWQHDLLAHGYYYVTYKIATLSSSVQ